MQRQNQILEDIIGDVHATFEPKMADGALSRQIFTGVRDIVKFYGRQLLNDDGWRFYGVRQTRGQCYGKSKVITIPEWVLSRAIDYKEWYVCHEMAHAFNYIDNNYKYMNGHDERFMEMLIAICPSDCVHYELEYKPRNAAAAGIKNPASSLSILDSIL